MNYLQLATAALGAGLIVAGVLLPATAQYLIPAGAGLLGLAIPAFSKKSNDSKD